MTIVLYFISLTLAIIIGFETATFLRLKKLRKILDEIDVESDPNAGTKLEMITKFNYFMF